MVYPLYLVEAAGFEPTVSSTRNWRDTTFATPRFKILIFYGWLRGARPPPPSHSRESSSSQAFDSTHSLLWAVSLHRKQHTVVFVLLPSLRLEISILYSQRIYSTTVFCFCQLKK